MTPKHTTPKSLPVTEGLTASRMKELQDKEYVEEGRIVPKPPKPTKAEFVSKTEWGCRYSHGEVVHGNKEECLRIAQTWDGIGLVSHCFARPMGRGCRCLLTTSVQHSAEPTSSMTSPLDEGLLFFTSGLAVHVFDKEVDSPAFVGIEGVSAFTLGIARLLHHWVRARCGYKTPYRPDLYIGSFNDNRLCRRCWSATPESEQHLLFEHDQDLFN